MFSLTSKFSKLWLRIRLHLASKRFAQRIGKSTKFSYFLVAHGIVHQHYVPHTLQQKGLVEKKNHTLKEMANCMMHSKDLPPILWVEAVNCVNYIQNCTSHKALDHMTPKEA